MLPQNRMRQWIRETLEADARVQTLGTPLPVFSPYLVWLLWWYKDEVTFEGNKAQVLFLLTLCMAL